MERLWQWRKKVVISDISRPVYSFGHPKNNFHVFFFGCVSMKKYVELVINDFTMGLIILNWIRRQKCGQCRKKMKPKDVETKEETVYESVFIHLNA